MMENYLFDSNVSFALHYTLSRHIPVANIALCSFRFTLRPYSTYFIPFPMKQILTHRLYISHLYITTLEKDLITRSGLRPIIGFLYK